MYCEMEDNLKHFFVTDCTGSCQNDSVAERDEIYEYYISCMDYFYSSDNDHLSLYYYSDIRHMSAIASEIAGRSIDCSISCSVI